MLTKNKQNNARLYCNNLKNFDVTIPDSARVRKHSNEDRDRRRNLTPPLREEEEEETEVEDCLVVKRKTTESPSKRQREMDDAHSRAIIRIQMSTIPNVK